MFQEIGTNLSTNLSTKVTEELRNNNFKLCKILCYHTLHNTVVSSNFLVWKLFLKHIAIAEFPAIPPKFDGNCSFSKNFHTRKLGEIT